MDSTTEVVIGRHSKKPRQEDPTSQRYEGVSEAGVTLARERATTLLPLLENSKKGSILFLLGASEAHRTQSTLEIYGDELERIFADQSSEYLVLKRNTEKSKRPLTSILDILNTIDSNPDKKIVVSFPLFVKEFSDATAGWVDKNGDPTEYYHLMMNKFGSDELNLVREWIKTEGKANGLQGPNPTQVAQQYLQGITRLQELIRREFPNRNIVIGVVGHSWNLDVLITYLAEGKVDLESFDKVTQKEGIIKETETAKITIGSNEFEVNYRGETYTSKKG